MRISVSSGSLPRATDIRRPQNGRAGGPIRDREHPEGINLQLPIIQLTTSLWECALSVFMTCYDLGIHAVIEHSTTAFYWRQRNTQTVLALPGGDIDACRHV